jgi:probable HAF family extracellular repeat protein
MKALGIAISVLAASAAWAAPPKEGAYEFRFVDFPGSTGTQVFAVNNFGQFVGEESDAAGEPHAIFDDGRELKLLDPAGVIGTSFQSQAFSINNRGEIAGEYQTVLGAPMHGFIYHPDGTVTTLDNPTGTDTQAFGINDLGTVIGIFNDSAKASHAFVLRDGQFASADIQGGILTIPFSINDREQIVGQFQTTQKTIGFGYLQHSDGRVTFTTAPGSIAQGTFFISINNHEQILGAFRTPAGTFQNFLKTGHDFSPFNLPANIVASGGVSAQTINDFGEIVGFYNDASNVSHAFLAFPEKAR